MSGLGTSIRPYRGADLAAVYDICVRTADAGGDARGQYSTDDLMPDLYAGPYVHLEPELAYVLDDDGRAVGYVVGTADTAAFAAAYRDVWIPRLAGRYPVPTTAPRSVGEELSAEEELIAGHHRPEQKVVAELAAYPAHLHIDLLPEYQGAGHGRELIRVFLAAAAAAGAPAAHLGMVATNTRARAFYDRLGFHEIAVPGAAPTTTYLGRSTAW